MIFLLAALAYAGVSILTFSHFCTLIDEGAVPLEDGAVFSLIGVVSTVAWPAYWTYRALAAATDRLQLPPGDPPP